MTPRSRSFVRSGGLAGLALLLAACGGAGSGGTPSGDGGTPSSAATRIVVNATSLGDLEDLCDDKGATVIGPVEGTDYYLVEIPAGVSQADFLEDMDDELEVEDAEEDSDEVAFPEGGGLTIPAFADDPVASVGTQPALARIGAYLAHLRGYTGQGVIVAVIDTGLDASHPLIVGHVAPGGYDFVDGDANPSDVGNGIDDDRDGLIDEGVGHGTFVASLVLAVAPGARILPIRALNSDNGGTASSIGLAIGYAVSHGAKVINLSAGVAQELNFIKQAVANARAVGVVVVASGGNRQIQIVDFPAKQSDALAVAAVGATDAKAPFSSCGEAIDLVAPGIDLVGAHPVAFFRTARWSGTSFSTALVAGAAALFKAADQPLPAPDDVARHLTDHARSVAAANPTLSGLLGAGILDLDAATRVP